MKVLNFGSCNMDYVYKLHHIAVTGETEHSDRMDVFAGGKGLNQSIAIARAGADVCHAGCIGRDGELLLTAMRESGVDVTNVRVLNEKTGHAIIQVSDTGENAIIVYAGANACITEAFIDEVLNGFSESDLLVLQNETSNVEYIIERAYERGMRVVFNPSPISDTIGRVNFDHISFVILNEIEAKCISGSDIPEKFLAYMSEHHPNTRVLLTLGNKGCIYRDGEETLHQSAFSVEVVDTTAAGDTFTGYFVASLCQEIPARDALRLASAAAAIAVSRKGASPSIPYADEVRETLPSLRECGGGASGTSERLKGTVDDYLKRTYKDASLTELAELLGYSAPYAGELVRKTLGKSFSALLHEKRCAIAAERLIGTEDSIREIIDGVGYSNESYFRKLFREIYGKTPFEYRKMRRNS
ncbi:MAG: helix-turn-helix domain-containing protein [Clostridia bacterium]|nr:helix-turn-helix domain-containing protein [Clostridia bacterium]